MATFPSPLVSPATPWFPALGAVSGLKALDSPDSPAAPWPAAPSPVSMRRPSRQPGWGWSSDAPAAGLAAAPRNRSPSNATLESPLYDLPMPSFSLSSRSHPRSPPRGAQPEPLRIPPLPKRSISLGASATAAPLPQHRSATDPRAASDADLEDPEDLSLFAEAMTGLDGGFMGADFGPPTVSPSHSGLGLHMPHPQSAGAAQTRFGFDGPLASRHDTLSASRPPVTSHSQPSSRMPTPDFAAARPAQPAHSALPYHPPLASTAYPPAPLPPVSYSHSVEPPAPRPVSHSSSTRAFAEELARLEDRPPDDELPDYATSQREAANANRMQALQRAQELERRWTQARFGRRRG